MAKKRASRGDFNMSEEVRNLLRENKDLNSTQVYDTLSERFPGRDINRNSCNVAFSQARRKLGIRSSRRKSVRKRRPGAVRQAAPTQALDFNLLKAARKFMAEAGSASVAISAINQVDSLQVKE